MSADTKSSAEIIEQIAELSGRDVHEVINHYDELKKNTAAATSARATSGCSA
jgi:ribosomal protein L12E/L44/L45/RPP1/RPP2